MPDRVSSHLLVASQRRLLVGVRGSGFLRGGQQELALGRCRDRDAAPRRRLDIQLQRHGLDWEQKIEHEVNERFQRIKFIQGR